MNIRDRELRDSNIVKYILDGHTFEETLIWVKQQPSYNLSSLSSLFYIWRKYKKTKQQEEK